MPPTTDTEALNHVLLEVLGIAEEVTNLRREVDIVRRDYVVLRESGIADRDERLKLKTHVGSLHKKAQQLRKDDTAYLSEKAEESRAEYVACDEQTRRDLKELKQLYMDRDTLTQSALKNLQSQVAALRNDAKPQSQRTPTREENTPRDSSDSEGANDSMDAAARKSHIDH